MSNVAMAQRDEIPQSKSDLKVDVNRRRATADIKAFLLGTDRASKTSCPPGDLGVGAGYYSSTKGSSEIWNDTEKPPTRSERLFFQWA